jgi:hypothetical protein
MRSSCLLPVAVLFGATTIVSLAQSGSEVKLPASPPGQAALQLGGTWEEADGGGRRYRDGKWVVIDYSRPLLRGRKNIFGADEDYGRAVTANAAVWRAGANATTRLTTQAALVVGDKTIESGVYNVFVDLKPDNWTLVLNTQPVQEQYDPKDKVRLFGAYNYDPKFDVARIPMRVRSTDISNEQFTIAFLNATDSSATLAMAWEHTVAMVDLRLAAAGTMNGRLGAGVSR